MTTMVDKQIKLKLNMLIILDWICSNCINGEYLNTVEIPDNDNDNSQEQWIMDYFGGCIPSEIEGGGYLYYYTSDIGDFVRDRKFNALIPNAEVELNGGDDYIYLYRVA